MRVPRAGDLKAHLAEGIAPSPVLGEDVVAEDDLELLDIDEPESYVHIFRYVSQAAWAMEPLALQAMTNIIAARIGGERLTSSELEQRIGATVAERRAAAQRRGNAPRRQGAVALMSLYGVIAPRASMVNSMSGPNGTGMDAFSRQLKAAVADPEVASIVIDVNSPGGSVDMVPETAALIRSSRDRKPIYANANTDAGSAAYWLAAQASEFSVTPSGMVGSIGVYSAHEDISAKLELEGRRVSLISAGKYKVENSPFGPLSEEAMAARQEMVDGYYDWFVNDVASGREVKAAVVRNGYGEGRMLVAKAALAEGMVDRIETLEETISRALNAGKAPARGTASSADPVTVTDDQPADAGDHYEYVGL